MASLHDMGGNVGQVESSFSRHRLTAPFGMDGGRAIQRIVKILCRS
jgi:hypothetical protein